MAFIDREDLHANGMLISDAQLHQIKELRRRDRIMRRSAISLLGIHHDTGGKISKKLLNDIGIPVHYSILICRQHDKDFYYAIYRGFKQSRHLGKGAYGTVKLAQDLQTGEFLALKIQPWSRLTTQRRRMLHDEIYKSRLAGNLIAATTFRQAANDMAYAMLMKLYRGNPLSAIIHQRMSLAERLHIAIAVAEDLKAIHNKQLIHLDIKPENIIYDARTGAVNIIDFGTAQLADTHGSANGGKVGTEIYMPPEAYSNDSQLKTYSYQSDIYSLGLTLGRLFKLAARASDATIRQLVINKPDSGYTLTTDTDMALRLYMLLKQMTALKPDDRPKLDNVISELKSIRSLLPDSMRTILGNIPVSNDLTFTGKSPSIETYCITMQNRTDKQKKVFTILANINDKIKHVQDPANGKYYTLKLQPCLSNNKLQLQNEADILTKMHRLEGSFISRDDKRSNGESEAFGLIMPFYPGRTLDTIITRQNTRTLLPLFLNMAKQVKLTHDNNILHNDIKPQNFVYDPNTLNLHLIDYGAALDLDKPIPRCIRVGTHQYLPSDMWGKHFHELSGKTTSEIKNIDIYSLGITMAEMMGITSRHAKALEISITSTDNALINLIRKMTDTQLKQQPDIHQVMASLETIMQHEHKGSNNSHISMFNMVRNRSNKTTHANDRLFKMI